MAHSIIGWIVIGIVAGWLTGKIMKGSGYGVILDMAGGPHLASEMWVRRMPAQPISPRPARTVGPGFNPANNRRVADTTLPAAGMSEARTGVPSECS